jgi:cell division ATPase FtsA
MTRLTKIAALASLLAASPAFAEVNDAVRNACRDDYHKYCEKLEVGSEELRVCMRTNATSLSKECLKALVENQEVTQQDIENYLKEMEAKASAENK